MDRQLAERLKSKSVKNTIFGQISEAFNLTPLLAEAYFNQIRGYFLDLTSGDQHRFHRIIHIEVCTVASEAILRRISHFVLAIYGELTDISLLLFSIASNRSWIRSGSNPACGDINVHLTEAHDEETMCNSADHYR